MKLQIITLALVSSAPLLALDDFTIVSDVPVKVSGEVYKGNCEFLEKKEKDVNKESGLLGTIKNGLAGLKKELTGRDCDTVGPVTIAGKKGAIHSKHKIKGGQWAVFFKGVSGAEAYIPAICRADVNKPGRYLLLQTPKSGVKTAGYGLKCTQVVELPW
jgi:hypothetical protein